MVVENYKPKIDIDPTWEMVELGSLCDFVRGPFGGSLKKEIFVNDGYAVYEQSHAIYNQFDNFRYFIDKEKFKEMKRFEVFPNDIIMSCSGTMGKVAIVPDYARNGIINQALLKLTAKEELIPSFLKLWMGSENFQYQLNSNVYGAAIVNVASVSTLKELKIPFLPIEIQRQIVSRIEKEQELVNANKQLIDIYEQKIKDRIAKVWGE
jgi:type I restriction enzyme S subunit